jgi:hypothetical protein
MRHSIWWSADANPVGFPYRFCTNVGPNSALPIARKALLYHCLTDCSCLEAAMTGLIRRVRGQSETGVPAQWSRKVEQISALSSTGHISRTIVYWYDASRAMLRIRTAQGATRMTWFITGRRVGGVLGVFDWGNPTCLGSASHAYKPSGMDVGKNIDYTLLTGIQQAECGWSIFSGHSRISTLIPTTRIFARRNDSLDRTHTMKRPRARQSKEGPPQTRTA